MVMLSAPSREQVEQYLTQHGVDLSGASSMCATNVTQWLTEMCTWNRKLDLTAARSTEALLDLMVRDAIELAKLVPQRSRVVDMGSGAGGPALALALLRTDLKVTLIDSLAKRTSFLRVASANHPHVDVRLATADDTVAKGEKWDVAISRATFAPATWLEVGARMLRQGGHCAVLLSQEAPPEHASMKMLEHREYSEGDKTRSIAWYQLGS